MSTFDERDVAFLRDLVARRHPERRAGPVALGLQRDHQLGTVKGARVFYTDKDFATAASLLKNRGHGLEAPTAGGRRQDAAPGGSEKTGAAAVTEHLVAIVPLNMELRVPSGTRFLAADWRELDLDDVEAVLVSENLEPLYDLQAFGWLQERFVRGRRVLAVFRGKPGSFSTESAAAFMRQWGRPLLGFYDFDPAGLRMASAIEQLEDLCLPPREALVEAVRRHRRTHLFTDQLAQARSTLDALPAGELRDAWDLMRQLQCGLPQENFPRA